MQSNITAKGRFRFKTYKDGVLVRTTDWIDNLIMNSANHGLNVIARRNIGDFSNDIEITSAEIGTGDTAPTINDTDLETPVLTGILRANQVASGGAVTLEFFMSDAELANGTYSEFGLRAGSQLYARALIDPAYTKSSNEDTSCEYQITYTNA